MYAGVIAASPRISVARLIMRRLRDHGVETTGVSVGPGRLLVPTPALDRVLRRATHLLVIPDSCDLPGWALYALGHARGAGVPACLVSDATPPAEPETWTVVRPGLAADHLLGLRAEWTARRRVDQARARLAGRENDSASFCEAALGGDARTVEDYLVVGMSPDARSPEGVPALVNAVRGRSAKLVAMLLDAGADPDAGCGNDGSTALCEAASLGMCDAAGMLLEVGADPDRRTANGQTALMLAASRGHNGVLEQLVGAGVELCHRDSLGMSAADYAKLFSHHEILATLEKLELP